MSQTNFETALSEFEAAKKIIYKSPSSRQSLLADLSKSFEPVGNKLRSRKNFHEHSFDSAVRSLLNTRLYTKNQDFDGKVLTRFPGIDKEVKQAQALKMKDILTKVFKIRSITFKSEEAENEALKILSTNFLAHNNGTLSFRKVNSNGLPGQSKYSLQDLLQATGVDRLVDTQRSKLYDKLHRAELMKKAKEVYPDGKKEQHDEFINQLLDIELSGVKAPVIPNAPYGEYEKESTARAYAELGLSEQSATLTDKRTVESRVKSSLDSLDDLTEIQNSVASIKEVEPESWNLNF